MSDELFGSNTLVDVDLYYSIEKTSAGIPRVIILEDDEAHKMLADEKKKAKVKKLGTKFRLLTWAMSNDLLKQATSFNHHKNDSEIDWTRYRDARLKASLVEWDIKDKEGVPTPLTEMAIDQLHVNIALALIAKYDEKISLDTEEVSKND